MVVKSYNYVAATELLVNEGLDDYEYELNREDYESALLELDRLENALDERWSEIGYDEDEAHKDPVIRGLEAAIDRLERSIPSETRELYEREKFTLHTIVQVGRSNGERRVWRSHEIEFERPGYPGKYAVCLALGRAAFNEFGTEYIHAESFIRDERGRVLFSASPSVVYEGIHDAWVDARLGGFEK